MGKQESPVPIQSDNDPDAKKPDILDSKEKVQPAGAIAVINERGEVLLMKRIDYGEGHGEDWVYPGGVSEPGENPMVTAVRETREEAGIDLDLERNSVFPIANYITAPDVNNTRHDLIVYAANYSTSEPVQPHIASPDEMTDLGWFKPEQILEMVSRGEMKMLPSGIYAINRAREYLSTDKVLSYGEVLMGGTFDRIHEGHKRLLTRAYETGDYVYIGVTTDKYIENSKKMYKEIIAPFSERVKNLRVYLDSLGVLQRTIILPLDDVAGPKALDPKLGALVLSEETVAGGQIINERRKNVGAPEMDVVVVPLLTDAEGRVISSTLLRTREKQG